MKNDTGRPKVGMNTPQASNFAAGHLWADWMLAPTSGEDRIHQDLWNLGIVEMHKKNFLEAAPLLEQALAAWQQDEPEAGERDGDGDGLPVWELVCVLWLLKGGPEERSRFLFFYFFGGGKSPRKGTTKWQTSIC